MYDGIKLALGPTPKKIAPIKSTSGDISWDRNKQLERWVEHFSDLYSRKNLVSKDALDAIECSLEIEDLDDEPSIEELEEALGCLVSGKAFGREGISAEVLKCCRKTIIAELYKILCLCWKEGEVPQDMGDANIVTLYKNKGDRGDCNNYRGISLLSIV